MSNPNRCAACDHKQNPDGGWCYMFRDEPTTVCMRHTMRDGASVAETIGELFALTRIGRGYQWKADGAGSTAADRAPSTLQADEQKGSL